ncbi:hypothetical protein L3Y34_001822 [Caenorhabditis briggsae]|uniref:Uncharacterized protein n=1 Tax=Caenorhabditis briggsae TaxID=6238 RepID=A0AAE9IRS7_CAEBR|nr:hypothetical protein L3Y34_001822 [Caenorhabditis briggsae]
MSGPSQRRRTFVKVPAPPPGIQKDRDTSKQSTVSIVKKSKATDVSTSTAPTSEKEDKKPGNATVVDPYHNWSYQPHLSDYPYFLGSRFVHRASHCRRGIYQ